MKSASLNKAAKAAILDDLSAQHNVLVVQATPLDCASDDKPCGMFKWLFEPHSGIAAVSEDPVGNDRAFLVALHEIGHAVVQRESDELPDILNEEALAWRWAIEHAGFELTPELWDWLSWVLRNDLDVYATDHTNLLKEAQQHAADHRP